MRFKNRKESGGFSLMMGDAPRFDGNTFSVRTEPGGQAAKLPEPIPLVGRDNKYVDVRYHGNMNIADNTVPVAAMDQDGSEFRKFDVIDMNIEFNYLGLGMRDDDRNLAYNIQFRITQQDAIAAAYASQLTELEFMAMLFQSDIPAMQGINIPEGKWTGSGQFASTIWYQAILQNVAAAMGKYNTLLSYADYLTSMGYNAEAHMTTRLLNLFRKQNIWTLFDQLGNLLKSEFFDLDFYREITMLNTVPSRKSDGIDSPLISMTGVTHIPNIAAFPKGAAVQALFDFDAPSATEKTKMVDYLKQSDADFIAPTILTFKCVHDASGKYETMIDNLSPPLTGSDLTNAKAHAKILDKLVANYSNIPVSAQKTGNPDPQKESGAIPGYYCTLQELITEICNLMSFPSILKWAREQYYSGSTATDPAAFYTNKLIHAMVALINAMSHFRSDTTDLVTFLRVLQSSTSMNTWVLDTPYLHPSMPRAQAKPVYFKLVHDLFTSYGTSGEMIKDESTRDWKIFTWWHILEGIPKYDAYDGGFTMAASVRGIPANQSNDYSAPEYMIPRLFRMKSDGIHFLSRRGKYLQLQWDTLTSAQFAASPIFAGGDLMELPGSIKLPKLSFSGISGFTSKDFSQAVRALGTLFGIGRVITSNNQTVDFLDPLMEGLIGRHFTNANTMALTYINGRAPFRVTSSNGGLGFSV